VAHAGEGYGIPGGITARHNCRLVYKRLGEDEKGYNRFRLIGCNSICKTSLGLQTFCLAFRFRQMIHGRQHEIVEEPAILFEPLKEVLVTPAASAECRFHRAPHMSQHRIAAAIEEIPAGRRGLTNK
jgi:hypothetical protein